MKKIPLYFILVLLFAACDGKTMLPNAGGAANEILVVCNDDVWESEGGRELFDVLTADVPGLPQSEPLFSISRIAQSQFDNILHPTRNIVIVEVDSTRYTKCTIRKIRDCWARSQAIIKITSNSTNALQRGLQKYATTVQNFFVEIERERQLDYLTKTHGETALQKAYDKFGIKIAVLTSINKFKESDDFLWMSNGSGVARQDIVIYSYPYTDKKQLTPEYLTAKRDSILCANIPGAFEGSCMGTASNYIEPSFNAIWVNDAYCAEVRGLWEMKNGEAMGGPFVSHTRLDELHNRLVTIEGFVYAPSRAKRNLVRQIEGMLYSVKMPQEVEAIVVTPNK